MHIDVLFITAGVCAAVVALGGLLYIVLVGGCKLFNCKSKGRKRK